MMHRLIRSLVVALATLMMVPLLPASGNQAEAARGFGATPLDDVLYWAGQEKRCGLSTNELAALMLAPTFPETGAPTWSSPSPMTMSRWDNQSGLHSFGSSASYRSAFWHPGIGPWQLDSAGEGQPYGAQSRINTFVAAAHTAKTMAARWCNSSGSSSSRRAYVWAPWYGCGSSTCQTIFSQIYNGSSLVGLDSQSSVTRTGGMVKRTCTGPGQSGSFDCWRVDPSKAEGHAAFAAPGYGPSPITAPFYVYTAGNKEYRHWLRADTGYDIGIWATRPLTANARTGLTWHSGEALVDQGSTPPPPPDPGPDGFFDVEADDWFIEGLTWAVAQDVMAGFPDATFRPDVALNRGQALSAIWKAQGRPAASSDHPFVDEAPSSWLDAALDWAHERGVVDGYPDGTFRASTPLDRAQYVMMMWRIAQRPRAKAVASFADTSPNAWFASGMSWAVEQGYMEGYPDATFRPGNSMTRAQAVMTFYRARQFDDVAVTDAIAPAVDWARFRRVVKGYADHTYRPANAVDRAEIVSILFQSMDAPTGAPAHPFTDVTATAWYAAALNWAAANDVLVGYPDGTYRGNNPVSRSQLLMMLWRIAGAPEVAGAHGFTDVAPGSWLESGLRWARANDILDGIATTTFAGSQQSNRGEVAVMLANLAGNAAAWGPGVEPPSTVLF